MRTLRLTLAFAASVAFAACEGATTPDPMPMPMPGGVTCSGKAPQPAERTVTLMSGGRARTFTVQVPASYDPTKPTPLVLNFHGYGSNGGQQKLFSEMFDKAEAAGFIAVYPEGVGSMQSWNGGACCGEAAIQGVDDVAFVGAILDQLESELCVDAQRIYATGMSNGGFMSHRLACELSDRIAAIAPVAGVIGVTACTPARPVPVMHFHGTMDTLVPYDGDAQNNFPSVADTMAGWVKRNGCEDRTEVTFQKGDSTCKSWQGCQADVVLCTVDEGGHTWPGGLDVGFLGKTTQDLAATDAMWDFFTAHPKK